jgi:prophage DNA circulation protein
MPSKISDFSAAVQATFSEIGASVDAIATSVSGVAGDVTRLKELIEKLQNNPGPISTEDQALLDLAQADVAALAIRVSGVKDAVAALDAATEEPPVPPVE